MNSARERQYGKIQAEIDAFHVARYKWASARVRGQRVLDCACGVGYGSKLLTEEHEGLSVVGWDISADAIEWANRYFHCSRTTYGVRDMLRLGLPNDSTFSTIVSLESLEHVVSPAIVLVGFARMLADGGNLLVSLPVFPTVQVNRFHKFEVQNAEQAGEYFRSCGFKVVETEVQHLKSGPFGLFNLEPNVQAEIY